MKLNKELVMSFFLICSSAFASSIRTDINTDGIIDLKDFSLMADEWLEEGIPEKTIVRTFPGPAKLKCDQVQRFYVNASQTKTVFDINDGPAAITNFWLACNFSNHARQSLLEMTFDDANEPQIKGLTGEIFGCGLYASANYRSPFAGASRSESSACAGYVRIVMPYYSSVKIEIQNPSPSGGYVWAMLERMSVDDPNYLYNIGINPGTYLYTHGHGLDGDKTKYTEVTLLDTNEPTTLAGLFHFCDNSSGGSAGNNFRFLEGDYRIYYGGELTPSYRCSGSEDFYHSSWYFAEGLFDHMDECLVLKNDSNYNVVMNRFFPLQQAPFDSNGIKFTWQVGEPAVPDPGNPYTRWITWYYK